MLSVTPLKNAKAAKTYYEKDNYYAKDSKEGVQFSQWWGNGAQKLGLYGFVKVNDFEKLLDGILPSGQKLGRFTKKGKKHRPGYDLTFSAPKSVSILAEIAGDHRIYELHDRAVQEAMTYLQKKAVHTRASQNGEIVFEKVDNLVVAMFRHDTSRELDPETHTHCVVLNMVEREDKKWRSLSSEALFDHKMVGGIIYRSVLARGLQEIGYEVEQTHADGRFEVKGITREEIEYFSQRRQQIEARLEKEGWEGVKASDKVTLATRQRKIEMDRDHLEAHWKKRCEAIYFDPKKLVEASQLRVKETPFAVQNTFEMAKEAIHYAAMHLGEREAVFSERDLIREALKHAFASITLDDIEKAISEANKKEKLIAVDSDHWTTMEAIELEENNIHLMKEGQQRILPMGSLEVVQAFITAKEQERNISYTKGQQDAIKLVLTTSDQVIGIQGNAGSGKTTMLRAVREFAQAVGYELLGLAPTKKASLELQEKTDISSMTLQKFLIEIAKKDNTISKDKPLLLLVDEASMISSRQMNQLLQILNTMNIQMALIGDVKQLAAIEAGKPFEQLQKAGMATTIMPENLRQKNQLLKEAVDDAAKGRILDAFKKIDITEESNKAERLQKIVDDYLSYSMEGRECTMVLVPANDDRVIVNEGIREGLKKEGTIFGEEASTTTLVSRGFSKTHRLRVTHYKLDDVVRFNKSYKLLGVNAGDYLQVKKIDRKTNTITLEDLKNQRRLSWNPEKHGGRREGAVEVYQIEKRNLMAGDQIRWLKNQGDHFVNAQTAQVLKIEGHQAEIRLQNQKIIKININDLENKHWDYAFSYTVYAKQGGENSRVIAHMESTQTKLSTQRAFYVIMSRGEYNVRLIVDDRDECIKTIEKHTGEKFSALEKLNGTLAPDWKTLLADSTQKEEWQQEQQGIRNDRYKNSLSLNEHYQKTKYWNVEDLQRRLSECTESLAKRLLGEPNHQLSSAQELRYGKKGSLWIPIAGQHVGGWKNFESGEKGNLIQLIQHTTGLGFKETLDYAGQFLGLTPEAYVLSTYNKVSLSSEKPKRDELTQQDKKAIARAVCLEQESLPIYETLAERYLREHRGINGKLSDSFRFHPRVPYYYADKDIKGRRHKDYFPALLAVAKNNHQKTLAVQVIYLDPKTANKASIDTPKKTYGRPKLGASVMINPGQTKVLIAEGPETGLSIAQAFPEATVMVTLSASNFRNVKLLPEQKEVILCMDNDGDNARSEQEVVLAAQKLSEQGHTVYLAKPKEVGQDFNDVLKLQGESAIYREIENAASFQPYVAQEPNMSDTNYVFTEPQYGDTSAELFIDARESIDKATNEQVMGVEHDFEQHWKKQNKILDDEIAHYVAEFEQFKQVESYLDFNNSELEI